LARCQGEFLGKTKFRFKNKLMSFGTTVIKLCAALLDWVTFRQTKRAGETAFAAGSSGLSS
jgi:hypothetical protein